jgi:TfoX/Sxy family transcriptional regulator of competence genes
VAFDERLAERVSTVLADVPDVREQQMFGGIAFLVGGHMACGVVGDELMLRLGEEGADAALDQPYMRPMDFTGKPMSTMVFVEPAGVETDEALAGWITRALAYVQTLPPKTKQRGR